MTSPNHEQLLRQLQHEVSEVQKQMARLFAATKISEGGRALPTGHVIKLNKVLPRSEERFHAALDALEEELQLAQLVMRRDLAVCREKAGLHQPPAATLTAPAASTELPDAAKIEVASEEAANGTENVAMEDSEAVKPTEITAEVTMEDTITQDANSAVEEPPAAKDAVPTDSEPKEDTSAPADAATTNAAAERTLQIDTAKAQNPPQTSTNDNPTTAEEEKPPDTANFSTTNDLDSLFGGPLSAGAGETTDFNLDPNTTADFDFDTFGLDPGATLDNDNVSSLLPGLEDYASGPAAGGEEIDFGDLFNIGGDGGGGEQSGLVHRDSTFDGLQDLADFNVDDFTGGGGGGEGTNENQDFEFDFS